MICRGIPNDQLMRKIFGKRFHFRIGNKSGEQVPGPVAHAVKILVDRAERRFAVGVETQIAASENSDVFRHADAAFQTLGQKIQRVKIGIAENRIRMKFLQQFEIGFRRTVCGSELKSRIQFDPFSLAASLNPVNSCLKWGSSA